MVRTGEGVGAEVPEETIRPVQKQRRPPVGQAGRPYRETLEVSLLYETCALRLSGCAIRTVFGYGALRKGGGKRERFARCDDRFPS